MDSRSWMLLVVFLVTPLFDGCLADVAPLEPARVFSPCAFVLDLGPEVSPTERASIAEALSLWQTPPSSQLPEASLLTLRFVDTAPFVFGFYDDETATVMINRSLGETSARTITIAHELGHAFGLPHVEDEPSVMNPANRVIAPTPADFDRLYGRWAGCP